MRLAFPRSNAIHFSPPNIGREGCQRRAARAAPDSEVSVVALVHFDRGAALVAGMGVTSHWSPGEGGVTEGGLRGGGREEGAERGGGFQRGGHQFQRQSPSKVERHLQDFSDGHLSYSMSTHL